MWRRPPGRAWDFNQALFDLGAQVCLARVPRCSACPLAAACPSRGLQVRAAPPPGPLRRLAQAAPRGARTRARCRPARRRRLRSGRRRVPGRRRTRGAPRRRPAGPSRGDHRSVSIPVYAANAVRCLAVKAGERFQALVDEPFADVGTRLCDAALAAGAASAACVVVPDSARPLTGSLRALPRLARRDRCRLLLVHRDPRRGVRAFPQTVLRTSNCDAYPGGLRRTHGPLDARARDDGRLRRAARAQRPPGRAAHGVRARARDDSGRHRLHVRRDRTRMEGRRRRARPVPAPSATSRRARSSCRRSRRAQTASA